MTYQIVKEGFLEPYGSIKINMTEREKLLPINYVLFVKACYSEHWDWYMDENGMRKAIYSISGMLYLIEKNVSMRLFPEIAYKAMLDIEDLETGEYDYLFKPEDLKDFKKDIEVVKDYLDQHQDIIKQFLKRNEEDYFTHLQFIPFIDEENPEYGMNYTEIKSFYEAELEDIRQKYSTYTPYTPIKCINISFKNFFNNYMNENGTRKAVYIINAMLYLMETGTVYEDSGDEIAYEAYLDIKDLETGAYDYLFEPEDLKLLKEDMKTVREYLDAHPDLKEEYKPA